MGLTAASFFCKNLQIYVKKRSEITIPMAELRENKMGTMPVNKLLLSMAVPMMVSMLVQALYNVVDSVFVSRLGQDALNAVSLAFPAQNLMIAVAIGTAVGVNASLSKSLGERHQEAVNKTAVNGVFLTVVHFALFCILGLCFSDIFFRMQTANAVIQGYGAAYLRICMTLSIGIFGEIIFERLLQSTGRAMYSMVTQMVGAVINIILDPILIFGYLGFPRMEVAGAALATVIGQIAAMALAIILNLKKNPDVTLNFRGFRPDRIYIRRIYAVGVPTMVMNAIGSVMVFCFNQILLAFTEAATAVFGVYFKLQSFIFMPAFGLNSGMVPIISYNYGARNKDRIVKTIKLAILYMMIIMAVGFAIFQMLPGTLLQFFEASEEMMTIGISALRIISINFLLAGVSIVFSSVFQAFSHGILSLIVSVARQLVVLLPAAYLLSLSGQLQFVWMAFPIAEAITLFVSIFCLRYLYRKEIQHLA